MDSFATSMRQLGRWSLVAGVVSLGLAGVISMPWLTLGGVVMPAAMLGLAVAMLVAAGSGAARLVFPGEIGRTWSGLYLAFFSGMVVTLVRFPDHFASLFFIGAVGLHLVANLAASARVSRERHLEPRWRIGQIAAVWILPVVGVMLVSAFYRSQDAPWQDDGVGPFGSSSGFFD